MGRWDRGPRKHSRTPLGSSPQPLLYELDQSSASVTFERPDGALDVCDPDAQRSGDALVVTGERRSQLVVELSNRRRLGQLITASNEAERQVLVDLEVARIIAIVGEAQSVDRLLSQLAHEIAPARLRRQSLLVVVGAPVTGAQDAPPGVKALSDLDELAPELSSPRPPDVVLIWSRAASSDPGSLQRILGGLEHTSVVVGALVPDARVVIALSETGPGSLYLRHEGAVPARGGAIKRDCLPGPIAVPASLPVASLPVEIHVLGPTEILGVDGSLERRPKLSELVVYLAMHPDGAITRTWTTALWPDRRVPPQTVANRLSEARRLLGFAPDDRPRLRRNGERHMVVDVRTDWEQFVELASPSAPPSSWRQALELVRGRPFEDLQQGHWTVFEGFVAEIEQAVAECALRYGEVMLLEHDADEAVVGAQRALRAAPFDERLHRLLMRAADAAGNRAGVEETLRNLALILEIDGDPLSGVHPRTAALYAELIGQAPAPTRW